MFNANNKNPSEIYYQVHFINNNTKYCSMPDCYTPLTISTHEKTRGFIKEADTALLVARSLPEILAPRIIRIQYFGNNHSTKIDVFGIEQFEEEIFGKKQLCLFPD